MMGPSPIIKTRVPIELQAVFLASNRGETVDMPPPSGSAYKVFHRKRFPGRGKGEAAQVPSLRNMMGRARRRLLFGATQQVEFDQSQPPSLSLTEPLLDEELTGSHAPKRWSSPTIGEILCTPRRWSSPVRERTDDSPPRRVERDIDKDDDEEEEEEVVFQRISSPPPDAVIADAPDRWSSSPPTKDISPTRCLPSSRACATPASTDLPRRPIRQSSRSRLLEDAPPVLLRQ